LWTNLQENKENVSQLQSVSNGYKYSLKQLEMIGMEFKAQTELLEKENRILQTNQSQLIEENQILMERIKILELEMKKESANDRLPIVASPLEQKPIQSNEGVATAQLEELRHSAKSFLESFGIQVTSTTNASFCHHFRDIQSMYAFVPADLSCCLIR
jgi:hypothetical protein